jgi:hypothetical protein
LPWTSPTAPFCPVAVEHQRDHPRAGRPERPRLVVWDRPTEPAGCFESKHGWKASLRPVWRLLRYDSRLDVFSTTGNGTTDTTNVPGYWGQSVLMWGPGTPLKLAGTYTPWNYCQMDLDDADLSGGAAIILPELPETSTPHVITFGGRRQYGLRERPFHRRILSRRRWQQFPLCHEIEQGVRKLGHHRANRLTSRSKLPRTRWASSRPVPPGSPAMVRSTPSSGRWSATWDVGRPRRASPDSLRARPGNLEASLDQHAIHAQRRRQNTTRRGSVVARST